MKLLKLLAFALLCIFFVLWMKYVEHPFIPALLFCIAAVAFLFTLIKK